MIFEGGTCEICQERPRVENRKRCNYCKERFDDNGEPFLIYCQTYRYEQNHKAVVLWVMDGRVVRVLGTAGLIAVGESLEMADKWLTGRKYTMVYTNEAVWKS